MEQDTRGCDANQMEIIRVNLELQPLPPTDFSTSNIVKVRYSIRVSGRKQIHRITYLYRLSSVRLIVAIVLAF